ncbi:MAG TPA: tetratricopeptide repeat protein [Kofleriaceae bacterium]|nr:tetratricopeptide repeat protein [Kofleriaceae bacterium]
MEQYGKYQLVRRIGTGGMAEVFLARTSVAQGLHKQLVIKKIHPAFARSRQFISMFVDEAKIALGLNHPNIVQVFDFGQVGDTFFLAMEYLDGMDLLRLAQHAAEIGRPIPMGICSYIVQQACKGLDYAHRKADEFGEPLGIVHRDISQQNVLVSWDGAVKIVDFGIARARGVHEEAGVIKGKFAYMAPEQGRGEPVDRRADVFSAGVVLFELVCGRPLYTGKGRELLDKVRAGAIPRPRYINREIPRELEAVILQALAYHPGDRFQTARDMQNALGRFQFQLSASADELIDSSALAQFTAQVVPDERRRRAPMPPSATASGTPGSLPGSLPGSFGEVSRPGNGAAAAPTDDDSQLDALGSSARMPPPQLELRERKYVFAIEGAISGLPLLERRVGRDQAATMVRDFIKVAQDIAFKHEAHVHRQEDTSFTFVVGLPVAGEDDATRAIRLALALVDALDGIGHDVEPELRLAVGIQRGVAVFRRERGRKFSYELAQSTTAIARRLAREAQGAEILVGGRVYRVARDEWTFEELTSIELPSDPDTQPELDDGARSARVYRLRGPLERAERMAARGGKELTLIGRDLELKAMRDAYRDVLLNHKKRHLVIVGDAGIGKRSLVLAFLEGIPQGEATIIRAAARVSTAYTPFAIVADLSRDLLGLSEGASRQEVTKRVERAALLLYPGEEQSRETRGLVQAVGLMLGGTRDEPGDDIDADERRQRVMQAMRRVESRLATDKPLIVIGEDVHWADDESSDLFREMLRTPSTRPILGIVTSRPEARVLDAAAYSGADVIRLDELDEAQRLQLVLREFAPGENVEPLAQQIAARTGGNPFFVREVLESLVERGIVAAEPKDSEYPGLLRWIKRDVPMQVPTTVESLLATRLDRLPQNEKDALLRAAVLGRRFTARALEGVLGRSAEPELAQLVGRGLLSQQAALYSFRNDMAMSVAYGLLPVEERSRLHRIAAAQIAGPPAGATSYRPGQDDAVIARHLELAGDASAAADRYLRAANHAIDVGGNADAFRQLTRALKLLPDDDHERRFTARHQREQILGRLARRPEQLREIHNLRKDAEAIGDPSKIALAHSRLAQFYIDVGKAPAASRAVVPALEYAREAGDPLAEAEALRLRASIARLVGNNDEALELADQALALCGEEKEGLPQRAIILNNRGTILWNMGRLHEASESYAEALVIYRMLRLPRQEARALNNMGIVFAALGEFEEALAHYKSSLKIDQELGDRASLALKLANIGQTYSDLGDTDRGERYLTKALKFADQTDDHSSAVDAAISLGQLFLQKGEPRRALELLDRGLALASEHRERYQEIRALIYISLGQLEAGDPPEGALELARSATELARKAPMLVGQIYGSCAQGMALARLGRADEAAALSAHAVELLDGRVEDTEGSEQIHYMHATLCERAGRLDDARAALARARAEVEGKLGKLRDPELRSMYLGSRTPAAILRDSERLGPG